MFAALIPAISGIASALAGRGGRDSGNDDMQRLLQSLIGEARPMLTQSLQRQQQMGPLYDAVLRMVGGQLPSWAGLDMNALLQPPQRPQATPRRSLQMRGDRLGVQ